jgi:predicted double-glycine peptidase
MLNIKLSATNLLLFITFLIFFTPTFALKTTSANYRNEVARFYGLKSAENLTLLNVKGYQQTTSYTCGPATVMSLMHYYGMLSDKQLNKETELQIAKEMGATEEVGTSPQQMVTWLEHHGFEVKYGENGTISILQDNLKKGIPTLVEWIDWGGHWEVVTGYDAVGKTYDDDKDTIFFANPSANFENANIKFINGITAFNPDRFASMWFDAQYFNPGHLVKGIYIIAIPKKS